VARLHYVGDLSQVKIARQLGVSTATISRLLARARAEGIVRIEVREPARPDALADEIAGKLGLRQVEVAELPPGAGLPAALAAPLSSMLTRARPGPGSVLALGWGRAMRAVIQEGLPPLPGLDVVAATGGLSQDAPHFQINEFVRMAAEQTGGRAHFIHAPYLAGPGTRDLFLADPAIASSVALWDRIEIAVVGVGMPPALTAPEARVATAMEQGLASVAGDVIRHYFDAAGRILHWDGAERLIAVSPGQLARARLCIGVAAGEAKAGPVIGAARAGLITALVTDLRCAEAILQELRSE
jgi:DNA-binding transcriptional regulator LsrR (DeoR family)